MVGDHEHRGVRRGDGQEETELSVDPAVVGVDHARGGRNGECRGGPGRAVGPGQVLNHVDAGEVKRDELG
jgi:hypothetical protein